MQRYFTQKAEKKKKVDEEDEESDESVSDTEFDDFLGKYMNTSTIRCCVMFVLIYTVLFNGPCVSSSSMFTKNFLLLYLSDS